jgi:inhibitor of KinA
MRYDRPRFLDQGEAALLVEFGDDVDPEINALVIALDKAFLERPPMGVRETTPTYRSLLVHYEPLEISRRALVEWIETRLETRSERACEPVVEKKEPGWIIPCCYDPQIAEDIVEAASVLDVSAQALAALHAGADYRAYMYGFAPGWCYLGGLPKALAIPRRLSPRGPTPPGAVLIGGGLSLVATNPMPTGWYVIGRTPERLFSLEREPPFLVTPGAALRFEAVDPETFARLAARAESGEVVARRESFA